MNGENNEGKWFNVDKAKGCSNCGGLLEGNFIVYNRKPYCWKRCYEVKPYDSVG